MKSLYHGLDLAGFNLRDYTDEEVVAAVKAVPAHYVDLTITAASVAWVSGTTPQVGVAGATITAGQVLYYDTAANNWKLTDSGVAGKWPGSAVALSGGSSGAYILLAKAQAVINIGATIVKNTFYAVSHNNPGGIAPLADIAAGWETVACGIGVSTTNMLLLFQDMGIAN